MEELMANHPVVHLDIPAPDPAAAALFYSEVFDWQLIHDEASDYWMFNGEGGPGGGFVKPDSGAEEGPAYKIGQVLIYIATDDIDGTLAQVEAEGGKLLGPKIDMGSYGAYAFFADPTGNTIGLYTLPAQTS